MDAKANRELVVARIYFFQIWQPDTVMLFKVILITYSLFYHFFRLFKKLLKSFKGIANNQCIGYIPLTFRSEREATE